METRPAPLDGMNQDDGLDEFRVSSPRDIQSILKQLLDGSVLLGLHGEDGVVFTTALWTLDGARGTIGFNADPADPAMAALLRGDEVIVVGYLDSVKIQFDVQGLRLVSGQRASVLACTAPRELYRFQRRDAFRVRPLTRTAPNARFLHPDMPDVEMTLRVVDISIGGCGLFLPAEQPSMNRGAVVADVRIELDSDTRIEVDMRLKHSTIVSEGARGARLGFEFIRPGGETLRTLQRFIDLTQKRGKLMALN
jgi:c-di-GMP-binding flagellar brake protein YcgR